MIRDDFYNLMKKITTTSRLVNIAKKDNCGGFKVFGIVLSEQEAKIINMTYANTQKEANKMNVILERFDYYSYQWSDCNHYEKIIFEKIQSIEKEKINEIQPQPTLF